MQINRSTVKFDENKNNINLNDVSIYKSRDRERSINRFGDKENNYFQPILTSYEAIRASLKNHETIIELLNFIRDKINTEVAKENKLEYVIDLLYGIY